MIERCGMGMGYGSLGTNNYSGSRVRLKTHVSARPRGKVVFIPEPNALT